MSEAHEITRKSQSNLAFAFFSLPKATRQDITTFYAFCRHVDDAADDPKVPLSERRHWLQGWRRWLVQAEPDEPGFATAEMLYIDPVACVDCGACVSACPVGAIAPDSRLTTAITSPARISTLTSSTRTFPTTARRK